MSGQKSKLTKTQSAIRAMALAYPEAYEEFPWGERVVKIKGKVFLFLGQPAEGGIGLSVKLPATGKAALELPFAEPTGYGLGKHGWVSARFVSEKDVPLELLHEWIDESFRAVAPKSFLAKVESGTIRSSSKGRRSRRK